MATKRKKKTINIEGYNKLIEENNILQGALKMAQGRFEFPIDSLLEIGTGTGNSLTKFLNAKEKSKQIQKFYGMEPIDDFFEISKRYVVRLSHTDATTHEY